MSTKKELDNKKFYYRPLEATIRNLTNKYAKLNVRTSKYRSLCLYRDEYMMKHNFIRDCSKDLIKPLNLTCLETKFKYHMYNNIYEDIVYQQKGMKYFYLFKLTEAMEKIAVSKIEHWFQNKENYWKNYKTLLGITLEELCNTYDEYENQRYE